MLRGLKPACLTVLVLMAWAVFLSSPATAAGPDLEVRGNLIRDDSTGRQFIPRGVNWPSFEYACVQGWGYSNTGATPETAQAMRGWNINTVRLPLNQDCWLGDDGQPANFPLGPVLTWPGYQDAVERFVDALTSAGIAVVIDLHWTGQDGTISDGLRPMADQRSDNFWTSVANRFKSNRSVIFDLFNEPHSRWDPVAGEWAFRLSWDCWRAGGCHAPDQPDTESLIPGETYPTLGMADLVGAVRSTGATQPIILSGLDYANDLREWSRYAPGDSQLIAGFHNYPGQACDDPGCWTSEIAPLAAEHPAMTTEFGQSNCQSGHLDSYMDWADKRRIGYLAWAWWVLPVEGCSNYALISNLSGTPTRPYGAAFRDHLVKLDNEPAIPPPPDPDSRPGADGADPEPGLERVFPRLRIVAVKRRNRRMVVRLRIRRVAAKAVVIRIKYRRKSRPGMVQMKTRVTDGKVRVIRKLRRGARPVWVFARYRGDRRLLPGKALLRLKGRKVVRR